jgi:hypothetical protein
VFCTECGLYLLEREELGTDPFETDDEEWIDQPSGRRRRKARPLDSGPLMIRLRIGGPNCGAPVKGKAQVAQRHLRKGDEVGVLEMSLTRPIRLGRIDPTQDIYPEVDLSCFLATECGVSREHARIVRRGEVVEVEDLASTNGTLLNGKRLAPYLPVPLQDGDMLQLGRMLIEVGLKAERQRTVPMPRSALGALPA